MDLSDLNRSPDAMNTDDRPAPLASSLPCGPTLVGELGAEVAVPLAAALARIDEVLASGRLDRAGLSALRSDIERARAAAVTGQRIARDAAAATPLKREQIELGPWLRQAVQSVTRQSEALGIELRQVIRPAQVTVDPQRLLALLQALLVWALALARSPIELRIEMKAWPVHAMLGCRFMHHPADEAEDLPPGPGGTYVAVSLDTMAWRLVQQRAATLGLIARREDTPVNTVATLEFPHTVNEQVLDAMISSFDLLDRPPADGPADDPPDGPDTPRLNHVLVLASRREVRNHVRESIRPMNLMVDYATGVDEARQFCADAPPQAVVYEAALGQGRAFGTWRDELLARVPKTAFVEICEEGGAMEVVTLDGQQVTRIGRDAVVRSLPSALSFELTRPGD